MLLSTTELKCTQDPDAIVTISFFNGDELLFVDSEKENVVGLCGEQTAQLRAALGGDADLAAELKRQIATERNLYQAKLLSLENDKADLLAERDVLQAALIGYYQFAGHADNCTSRMSSRENECDCGFYDVQREYGNLVAPLIMDALAKKQGE